MRSQGMASFAVASLLAFSSIPHSLASPLFSTDSPATTTPAPVLPRDIFNKETRDESCANPCGWGGWLCCNAGQYCYTDSQNQAQCGNGAAPQGNGGSGSWQYYTSTWVETDLITKTSVYSYWQGQATPAAVPATPTWNQASQTPGSTNAPLQCNYDNGEQACGSICCVSGQYCLVLGQCANAATGGAFAPPLRPTASTLVIQTATVATTTTLPFIAPIPTGQNSGVTMSQNGGGLSGGAIAGIVIGVLAALVILFFLIVCLCAKGIWDGLVALFGGRKKPQRKETVEYYSRHSDRQSRRWYGDRPARIEQSPRRKKSGLGLGGTAGLLGGLAIALGVKRRMDKRRDEKSDYSGTMSSSDYTSVTESELTQAPNHQSARVANFDLGSSDRRTRDTRRTRR